MAISKKVVSAIAELNGEQFASVHFPEHYAAKFALVGEAWRTKARTNWKTVCGGFSPVGVPFAIFSEYDAMARQKVYRVTWYAKGEVFSRDYGWKQGALDAPKSVWAIFKNEPCKAF